MRLPAPPPSPVHLTVASSWLTGLGALLLLASPATAGHIRAIYDFRGQPDGDSPLSTLVMDSQGRLYGTTMDGGVNDLGSVFRLTAPATGSGPWTEQLLHSLGNNDGVQPVAPVTLGSDGSVYGTTLQGGQFQRGTVFSLANAPNWPFSVLHAFRSSEGGYPKSGLLFGAGGLLYGNTIFFSEQSYADTGTIFSISPLGDQVEYSVLHAFGRPGDGYGPVGLNSAAAAGFNGFVGASGGGPDQNGNIFSFATPSGGHGTEKILYSFGNPPDVNNLFVPPIVGAYALAGNIVGCGSSGGANNQGGIYQIKLTAAGPVETILYNFGDQPNDPRPDVGDGRCYVVQADKSGKLYGTSEGGGANGQGTLFELDPPATPRDGWTEKVDNSFDVNNRVGSDPQGAPLVVGAVVYGTTTSVTNGYGAVYQYSP